MAVDFEERVDFTPAARLSAGARPRRAGSQRARRAADVRCEQHPLHHRHDDRRVGARQGLALLAAHRRWRAGAVGLRLRRRSITGCTRRGCSRTTAAAGMLGLRGAVAARRRAVQRRGAWRSRTLLERGRRRPASRSASTWSSRRCCSSCRSQGIEVATGSRSCSRPARSSSRTRSCCCQPAAAMVDGVYHDIAEALKPGRARERDRRAARTSGCTRWARTTSRRSTRSPASAATRIRTTSPTG